MSSPLVVKCKLRLKYAKSLLYSKNILKLLKEKNFYPTIKCNKKKKWNSQIVQKLDDSARLIIFQLEVENPGNSWRWK